MLTNAHKLSVKLFLAPASHVDPEQLVSVFHGWIQRQAVADHLLVDVANYAHAADGPGIVLVSHEANFYFDEFAHQSGLTYQRKQPAAGSFADRLAQAFSEAIAAAVRLEEEPVLEGKVRFRTDRISFKIADRLLAPNSDESLTAARPELQPFARRLLGDGVTLLRRGQPRDLFEVELLATAAPRLTELLTRLSRPVAV
jgi:hypothetical protein